MNKKENIHIFENPYPSLIVVGVDEVGRGCLAGPVVASAVVLNNRDLVELRDSKKLSKQKREKLYSIIIKEHHYAVGIASVKEIDSINILQASLLAMKRAVEKVNIKYDIALVDGNQKPNLNARTECFVKGDDRIMEIAAASIIAKVTRDNMMAELALKYPEYNWENNAGYGSKTHMDAIYKFGITPYHRKTFKIKPKQMELT